MAFAPRALELPLLMSKKVRQREKNEKLVKYLKNYPKYSNCDGTTKSQKPKESDTQEQIPKPNTISGSRDLIKNVPWKMAPNRYLVKDVQKHPEGFKGSFMSTLPRTSGTIIGHHAESKYIGTHQFYEISTKLSCGKYKFKFNSNPRDRRSTLRLMVNDPNLCWRDPNYPGPSDYNPKNYSLNVAKIKKSARPLVYSFLPNSIVPAKENSIHENITSRYPGPNRFNPVSAIVCPCSKTCYYEPDAHIRIEMEKIKKFRRNPYRKIKGHNYCEDAKLRNIQGHGHQYIFKGEEKFVPKQPVKVSKFVVDRPMFPSIDYIEKINNPNRKRISHRTFNEKKRPKAKEMRFNSLAKPILRRRIKENKKIVFMSGVPRWKIDETQVAKLYQQDVEKKAPPKKEGELKKKIDKYAGVKPKLFEVPDRLQTKVYNMREKYFVFSVLPPPKVLVKHTDVGNYGKKPIPFYTKELEVENFFKDK